MNQKNDAPEGGVKPRLFRVEGGADRPMLRFGALDGFVFEDAIDEDILANLKVWLNRMLESDQGVVDRLAPTPPAPDPWKTEPAITLARQRDEAEAVLLSLGWGKLFGNDWTPPAPSGLVDAAEGDPCPFAEERNSIDWTPEETARWNAECDRIAKAANTRRATLSGQQGGVVPAGDPYNEGYQYGKQVGASQERTRARPAEQPAPDKPEDGYARKIDLGSGWYVARFLNQEWRLYDDRNFRMARFESEADTLAFVKFFAEQPAPAGTGADGVEGVRDLKFETTNNDIRWFSQNVPPGLKPEQDAIDRLVRDHKKVVALRAALDAGSSEEGRS